MRNFKWLLAASLAVATTGCVETVDSNYPNADSGYSNGYYAPTYYAPAYTAARVDTYYAPRAATPQVVRETRPVPTSQTRPAHEQPPQQRQADRGTEHPASTSAASGTNNANHGTQQSHRDHNGHDGDGRPDRRS